MITKTWNFAIYDKDGDLSDYSDDFNTLAQATEAAELYVIANQCDHVTLIHHKPLRSFHRSLQVMNSCVF